MAESVLTSGQAEVDHPQGNLEGVADKEVNRWLGRLALESRTLIVITIVAGFLAALATVVQMTLLAWIVYQGLVMKVAVADLVGWFAGLLATILARGICQGFQNHWAAQGSLVVQAKVRRSLSRQWRRLGPAVTGDLSSASLAREWLDHVDALHGYYAHFLPQMVLSVMIPLLVLLVVLWLDWLAALFLLVSAPLIPLFMALVGMGAEKLNQQHFRTVSRLSGQFLDKVRGLTTLQLFGQTAAAQTVLRERSEAYRRITLKTLKVAFLSSAVLEFFASVAIAVVAIYIGFGLLGYIEIGPSGDLTLFTGLLVLLLAPEFFQPLRTLSQHYHDRAAALGAGAEILMRLRQPVPCSPPSPSASGDSAPGPTGNYAVVLEGVSFAYDCRRRVFRDLCLAIEPGEVVALTGPSGGGKSTLLHLMAGFLQPCSGSITAFGLPPGERSFGWLGQSPFIVHGSWADNIRLTTPDASDIAIESALRLVGLESLRRNRADGIYSEVSESGHGLSGGQARRLSLARIFVAGHELILLDEPTAGLDADSEIFVLDALYHLARSGKTLVFSTHHQALLTLADRIMLVSDGEVRHA